MDGIEIDGNRLTVKYAKQKCTFTQDTGYITNTELDNIKVVETSFDSSLPLNHYAKKREAELKTADVVYNVRVDDLPDNIT